MEGDCDYGDATDLAAALFRTTRVEGDYDLPLAGFDKARLLAHHARMEVDCGSRVFLLLRDCCLHTTPEWKATETGELQNIVLMRACTSRRNARGHVKRGNEAPREDMDWSVSSLGWRTREPRQGSMRELALGPCSARSCRSCLVTKSSVV